MKRITKPLLFILLLLVTDICFASEINFKVLGNKEQGYYVNIYYGSQLISSQDGIGELDLCIENEDYSALENVRNWKATSCTRQGKQTILSGNVYLKKLETDVNIAVIYEVINKQVISKQIELSQTNASLLYYSVATSLSSKEKPSSFWSFDDQNNLGGIAHETYPAAGYMLQDSIAVGLLTDSGSKNLWTRNIRRRPSKQGEIGFRAIREICDANLVQLASPEQRKQNDNSVKLTFGEVSDFNHPVATVSVKTPPLKEWKSYNGATAEQHSSTIVIKGKSEKAIWWVFVFLIVCPTAFIPSASNTAPNTLSHSGCGKATVRQVWMWQVFIIKPIFLRTKKSG